MNRMRTATTRAAAMLVVVVLVAAAAAMAGPASTQAEGDPVPSIRVGDTGEAFVVRWTSPEGMAPSQQVVEVWTDDGFRRTSSLSIPVPDEDRRAEVRLERNHDAGTAYGFRVSMLAGDQPVHSPTQFLFPHGPMTKRTPSGLEAHWHDDELRLGWAPGRSPRYVKQIAKCRLQERGSAWETVELARHVMSAVFDDFDLDRSYVCRVEARKANGNDQMTNAANANRKRIATPGNVTLARTAPDADTVRFGWSLDDTDGIAKLVVQREGPLPNDRFATEPSWATIAELEPDTTSHVDTLSVEDGVVFYNYRVIAVAERGGPTVSWRGVCRLERDGEVERYACGRASNW